MSSVVKRFFSILHALFVLPVSFLKPLLSGEHWLWMGAVCLEGVTSQEGKVLSPGWLFCCLGAGCVLNLECEGGTWVCRAGWVLEELQ